MDILYFLFFAGAITIAGRSCSRVADKLADLSGIGEAIMGGVFLGASTSIAGTVTSVTSASHGFVDLAISNSLGGIALQTLFLAFADIVYKKSNLEHASASTTNIMMGVLLILLLIFPIWGQTLSDNTYLSIHPITLVLFCVYIFGIKYIYKQNNEKMWFPRLTRETVRDISTKKKLHLKIN